MKWKNTLLVLAMLTFLSDAVSAADGHWKDRWTYETEGEKFGPNEFQIDMFGTYASRDRFGVDRDRWGGGLGLNYFPSKYFGIGADSYLEEWKWPYKANGSLFLRLPIEGAGFAPYIFGGGGRQWKYLTEWTVHGGAGLEFRFNRYTALFGDARRVFSVSHRDGDELDYWLARAGLRFNF